MIKEYVPKAVKALGEPDGYGVVGYSVTFSTGENALLRAKNAPEVGKTEYGQIVEAPKKDGSGTYKKFERMQRMQQSVTISGNSGAFNTAKSFTADPGKISSIEWQKAIAEGRQLVRDWLETSAESKTYTLEEYKKEVVNAAVTLAAAINKKPDHIIEEPKDEPVEQDEPVEMGRVYDDTTENDLPPVENYDGYF